MIVELGAFALILALVLSVLQTGMAAAGRLRRSPVLAGAASMVLVLAGGAWFLGAFCGLGLPGIWLAYALDEWIRGLLLLSRWLWRGWLPNARDSRRRLRAEKN